MNTEKFHLIYDCSNSLERPNHRGGGGPIVNDIMRYLHEYAESYHFKFVENPNNAQVIITNDVFPKFIIDLGKPMVKRMCGPFWKKSLSYRNDILNHSARLADKVIFISDYSKRQYFNDNDNDLKSYCVVTHWVDPKIFVKNKVKSGLKYTLAACATNWDRPEKRLNDLIKFAEALPNIQFLIIGEVEQSLPSNFIKVGYLKNPRDIAKHLNMADAFINLTYRDAATKTIPQAISCGLPVLYANSGGVKEMVNGFGIEIEDSQCVGYEDEIPSLNLDHMLEKYNFFRRCEFDLKQKLDVFDSKLKFTKMLEAYFNAITYVI
jgi:glycosyltransferase involved in cell wall biosynthesis